MLKLDHIVFPTPDAGASLAFYRDVLGLPLIGAHSGDDWGGYPWLMMIFALADGRELVLVELRGATLPVSTLPADVRHIAMAEPAVEWLGSWRQRLKAAGVDFWEEDHGEQQSLYFADPSGTILEITAPPSNAHQVASPAAEAEVRRWLGQAALTA
jgi:catechol 2,3-dioxygenase-like lactoylglutathione lyase family enzyme